MDDSSLENGFSGQQVNANFSNEMNWRKGTKTTEMDMNKMKLTSNSILSLPMPSTALIICVDDLLLSFCCMLFVVDVVMRLPIIGSLSLVNNKSGGALHDDGALVG